MGDKYEAANTYTDDEILALFRECLARISVSGQSYMMQLGAIGGTRMYTSADLEAVSKQIDWLERRISAASTLPRANYARMVRG